MYITYIGHNYIHDLNFKVDRPSGSGDYLVLLIKSHGIITIEGKDIIVKPNTLFLYKEGTPQLYRAHKEPFSNDWFHFKLEEKELEYFNKLNIPFEKPIHLNNTYQLSLIIKNIAYEKYSNSIHSDKIIQNYMDIFFIEISRLIESTKEISNLPHYEEMSLLRSKIYTKPYENWSISLLSNEISLSPSHFQRLYKKLFGVTCIQDVINSRIESAKYYLIETSFTVKHISEILGYENYEHFIRQFENKLNCTPSEYRKSHISKSNDI
ncbi:MAG: helix-turn-helix domain-containing protein [Clostridium sp.]|nr:helix-turn-helix domain-containing protein [Clostridium sp.]